VPLNGRRGGRCGGSLAGPGPVVRALAARDVRDGSVGTVGLVGDVLAISCQKRPGVLERG